MMTRRDILGATGVLAAASAVAAKASAVSLLSPTSHKANPVVFVSDDTARELGLAVASYNSVTEASVSSVTQKTLPKSVSSNFAKGLEWLDSHRGSSMIFAVDTRYGFILDELLKESHARTLFKGEHYALGLNQGPVSHQITELPVSAGIASSLPESGAWTDLLMTSLAKVANRSWQPTHASKDSIPSSAVRPASAKLALATYVIEI